jgi:replicative DNA helicase
MRMTRDQARDYVRAQIEQYLQSKGIETRRPFSCLNPAHKDRHPSMSLDRSRGKVHCFSCGKDYDTLDLIGIDYGLTEAGAIFQKAYELYGIEVEGDTMQKKQAAAPSAEPLPPAAKPKPVQAATKDFTAYCEAMHKHIAETDYPQRRGLTEATINRFKLGFDKAWKAHQGRGVWKALIIPTANGQFVVRNTDATAKDCYRYDAGEGPRMPINLEALKQQEKPIFIVEGELDALSIVEAGGEAVGLGGKNNKGKLLQALEGVQLSKPLILSLDNDEAGQKTQAELAEELRAKGIPFLEVDINRPYKDANEALMADREAFIATVAEAIDEAVNVEARERERERQDYLKNSAAGHIDAFLQGIASSIDTRHISTGFPKLDAALDGGTYGGLYDGLYIIGAISSLGKTTLVLQIADNIARDGQDVLIFSLEMARAELMAKSISRHTLIYCLEHEIPPHNAKTNRGITSAKRYEYYTEQENAVIAAAIKAYEEYAHHVFITEGVGDIGVNEIRATIEKHKRITGNTPVVVVDYLQIIAPYNDRATDKQNTDKAVLELKRISRDFKTPVIGISSLNRASYNEPVSMAAFKETGAIEYSADVLIGLQLAGVGGNGFDVNAAKAREPRQIELVVLKNRNGPTGGTVAFEYYPKFNYFVQASTGKR